MTRALRHDTVLTAMRPGDRVTTRDVAVTIQRALGRLCDTRAVAACLGYLRRQGAVRRHPGPRPGGRGGAWEALQERLPL